MFTQTDLEDIERGRRDYGAVLPLLRGAGSLWHRTSVDSLRAILASGHILPNVDKRFASPWGTHYGREIGAVCLFDFDSASEDEIFWQSIKWGPFVTDQNPVTVWIEIPRVRLDPTLIESPFALPDKKHLPKGYTPKFFPYVEAWHREPLPIASFASYLAFPGFNYDVKEHRRVPTGPKTIEEIAAIGAEWQRLSKERRDAYITAGGLNLNLAEIVKKADAKLKARREGTN